MNTVPSYDFEIIRGDDKTFAFTIQDSTGTAINLTGYTGVLELKRDTKQPNLALSVTATLGGVAGTFSALIPNSFTTANDSRFHYKAKITSGSAIVTTKLIGLITLIQR